MSKRLLIRGFFPPLNGWAWSELHINYAGGFVRRGLLGEIAFRLQSLFGLTTTAFFGTIFFVLMLLMIGFVFWLLRPVWSRPLIVWVVLLSPAILLFPVFERGAALRKDVFVSIALVGHALMVQAIRHGRLTLEQYQRLMLICIAPFLAVNLLIHEEQWFFLPVHMILSKLAVGTRHDAFRRVALMFIPAFLLGPLTFAYSGDSHTVAAICNSWRGRAEVNCSHHSGIGALGWSLLESIAIVKRILASPRVVSLWALAAVLSTFPAVVLLYALRRHLQSRMVLKASLVILVPTLPLFVLGGDWGRWLHLLAISEVAVLLPLAPFTFTTNVQRRKLLTIFFVLSVGLYVFAWHLPYAGSPSNMFEILVGPGRILTRAAEFLK